MSEPNAKVIAALCVSGRSIYKHLPGVIAYDSRRDARTFPANMPFFIRPAAVGPNIFVILLNRSMQPAKWNLGAGVCARF